MGVSDGVLLGVGDGEGEAPTLIVKLGVGFWLGVFDRDAVEVSLGLMLILRVPVGEGVGVWLGLCVSVIDCVKDCDGD